MPIRCLLSHLEYSRSCRSLHSIVRVLEPSVRIGDRCPVNLVDQIEALSLGVVERGHCG